MPDQKKYEDVLIRARKRYAQAVQAEADIRAEFELDLAFIAGDQWNAKVKRERERGPSPRPCLVFNKVLPPVTQLGNQARQNKPAIQVNPVDSKGDPDTAKVLAGMVKHIEYDSDADQAYDTALFYAAAGGFGYWRYGCEYSAPDSFDQDIKTITVDDPLTIYLDCWARKPDRSDMKWAFVIDKMANDVHEARFGPDEPDLSSDFVRELGDEGWIDDDGKRVAEYWEVDSIKKTLRIRKDPDGVTKPVYLEDLEPGEEETLAWVLDEDTGDPLERETEIPRVMQYIINGAKVLEEPTRWDGDTIPIVIVTGLEMVARGKRKIFSMTRFARDPQQLLNFYKTMEAETIALAPKPKWVGYVGQFKSKRRDWQRANVDSAAYLEADMIEVGGKSAGLPEWRTFDPPVQALNIGSAAATNDIQSASGYYPPSLGENKGDLSGVAVGKLQKQGDVSNFHFMDNLARALKRGGRIIVQLIPYKYDTAREVRIIGEDQKQRIVTVNAPYVDSTNGKSYHHKLDQGKYDVRVQQGTSYDTQRIQTREMMMALAQEGNSQIWQLAADIFFENQDFIGADRLAKRFHAALPPAILAQEEQAENKELPPAVQQQLQTAQQGMQELQQQNAKLIEMLKSRMLEKTLEMESKERQTTQSNVTKVQVAETMAKSGQMNKLAELDHAGVKHSLDMRAQLLHDQMTVEADASGQAMDHNQDQQSQQSAQDHAANLQDSGQQHQQQMQQQQLAAQPPAQEPGA